MAESLIGRKRVAALIHDDRNRATVTVSASGPTAEFTEEALPFPIKAVRTTALIISDRLGHRVLDPVSG